MMFDVLSLLKGPLHPEPDGALPHWCTYREMDSDIERVCCRQSMHHCISTMAEHRQFRHSAYRQFVLWQHGRLVWEGEFS